MKHHPRERKSFSSKSSNQPGQSSVSFLWEKLGQEKLQKVGKGWKIQCNNSKKNKKKKRIGPNQFSPFQDWGPGFVLKLKTQGRFKSSSHWGPLKASQFFRAHFSPQNEELCWLICRFFRGFWGFFPRKAPCLWDPGGFWGFPRWAVRL